LVFVVEDSWNLAQTEPTSHRANEHGRLNHPNFAAALALVLATAGDAVLVDNDDDTTLGAGSQTCCAHTSLISRERRAWFLSNSNGPDAKHTKTVFTAEPTTPSNKMLLRT
jgi:hypothetical protein